MEQAVKKQPAMYFVVTPDGTTLDATTSLQQARAFAKKCGGEGRVVIRKRTSDGSLYPVRL